MSSITLQEEIIFAPLLYVKIRESERSYEQIYTHVCARMILGFDTHIHTHTPRIYTYMCMVVSTYTALCIRTRVRTHTGQDGKWSF